MNHSKIAVASPPPRNANARWAPWEEGIYVIYITEEGELLPMDPEEGTFITEEGERWIRTASAFCRSHSPLQCVFIEQF